MVVWVPTSTMHGVEAEFEESRLRLRHRRNYGVNLACSDSDLVRATPDVKTLRRARVRLRTSRHSAGRLDQLRTSRHSGTGADEPRTGNHFGSRRSDSERRDTFQKGVTI